MVTWLSPNKSNVMSGFWKFAYSASFLNKTQPNPKVQNFGKQVTGKIIVQTNTRVFFFSQKRLLCLREGTGLELMRIMT